MSDKHAVKLCLKFTAATKPSNVC